MKEILVVGGMVKGGGISQYINQIYSQKVIRENVKVNIVIEGGQNQYIDEFKANKWNSIYITPIRTNLFKYIVDWYLLLKKNKQKYSAIHFHYDSLAKPYAILIAKFLGYDNIIIHSHSSYNHRIMNSSIGKTMHSIGKKVINRFNFKYVACSDKAAGWFFNNYNIENNIIIAKNGVDTNKFKFSENIRRNLRSDFNIDNKTIVYGHIGRFDQAKNHEFLINVFYEILKNQSQSKLLLVGIGPERDNIKNKVKELGIQKNVYFLGLRNDVEKLMQTIDVIIFPSKYEGLPLTIVEAQTSGVVCFLSDTITKDLVATKNIYYLSLNKTPKDWANTIETIYGQDRLNNRQKAFTEVLNAGFDIEDSAKKILELY